MKRYSGFIMVAFAAIFLSGCIGSGGSSAPAPNNVAVVAKDSRVIVTWDTVPGVEYWIWRAYGSGVTPQNCSLMSLCSTDRNVTPPAVLSNLNNGYTYSVSINGRIENGPGGPGSAAEAAMPRTAGTTWTAGISPSASIDLRSVAYGTYGGMFVAVGTGGAMYSNTVSATDTVGTNGTVWTALNNPLASPSATDFNAVNYDNYREKFLSVGTGGKMIAMTPSVSSTWTELTGYTGGQNLLAIANNGAGLTVVTGANGTIIRSTDGGVTWMDATFVPAAAGNLNSVAYGYSTTLANNIFVAVGASGTVLYSTDGDTWTNVSLATLAPPIGNLNGVTYGGLDASGHSVFVAVGANGTVLTSPDAMTWTPQTSGATAALNAVAYSVGRRFVAVAADGNIYYSEYYSSGGVGNGGEIWEQVAASPVTTIPLYAVATGGLYDFSAVGAGGVNAYAD